jgi:hypothetical protein
MARITLKGRVTRKVKVSKVTERFLERQEGFIVLLLLLVVLLFVMTPVGCATVLALVTGTGAAAAP